MGVDWTGIGDRAGFLGEIYHDVLAGWAHHLFDHRSKQPALAALALAVDCGGNFAAVYDSSHRLECSPWLGFGAAHRQRCRPGRARRISSDERGRIHRWTARRDWADDGGDSDWRDSFRAST